MTTSKTYHLSDDVSVTARVGPGNHFLDIAAITVGGVPLTDGDSGIRFYLDAPDGRIYPKFALGKVLEDAEQLVFEIEAAGMHWPRTEFIDHYGQSILKPAYDRSPVTDRLTLTLKPVKSQSRYGTCRPEPK